MLRVCRFEQKKLNNKNIEIRLTYIKEESDQFPGRLSSPVLNLCFNK